MTTYKTLTIKIADELHDELHEHAEAEGITVTELLRQAVALHLFVLKNRGDRRCRLWWRWRKSVRQLREDLSDYCLVWWRKRRDQGERISLEDMIAESGLTQAEIDEAET